MGAVPLILNTVAGHQFRKLDTDCDIPGNTLTLDSDNAGAAADCSIVAEQGASLNGVIKFAAADGRWEIVGPDTTNDVLFVQKAPSTAKAGVGISLSMGANATGNGLGIAQAGNADAINIALSHISAQALVVADSAACTSPMVELTRSTTGASGHVIKITKSPGSATVGDALNIVLGANSNGYGIYATHAGGQRLIYLSHTGTALTNPVVEIRREPGSSSAGQTLMVFGSANTTDPTVYIYGYSNSATGHALVVERNVSSGSVAGDAIHVTTNANAQGNGVSVTMAGDGDALNVVLANAGSGVAQALVVTETTAGTNPMIELTRNLNAATGHVISISKSPASAGTAGDAINITMGVNANGCAINIVNDGANKSLYITASGGNNGIHVIHSGASSGIKVAMSNAASLFGIEVYVTSNTSGSGMVIDKQGGAGCTGFGLRVQLNSNCVGNSVDLPHASSGDAINVAISNTAGQALVVTESTAGTNPMVELTRSVTAASGSIIKITKNPGAASTGYGIEISMGANTSQDGIIITHTGTGAPLNIQNDGTNVGIYLVQSGANDALRIALDSNTGAQAIVAADTVACTTAMVQLTRSTAAATGHVISITKNPGSATSGRAIDISMGANTNDYGINLAHSGTSIGLVITVSGGAQAIGLNDSTAARALPLLEMDSNGNATGDVIDIVALGSGTAIIIDKSPGSAKAGVGIDLTMGANASGNAINVTQVGSGISLNIDKSSASATTGNGVEILLGQNHTARGLQVGNHGTGYTVFFYRTPSASRGGINVQITSGANCTGEAIRVDQNGTGVILDAYAGGNLRFRLSNAGNGTCDGTWTGGGADYAEMVEVVDDKSAYAPGDVLVVAGENLFDTSVLTQDVRVAGVVSTKPSHVGNGRVGEDVRNVVTMGMMGMVPTKCITEGGSIVPGDLLCTSSTEGRAMKAPGNAPRGTILGKALGSLLDDGNGTATGLVSVYVNLQ